MLQAVPDHMRDCALIARPKLMTHREQTPDVTEEASAGRLGADGDRLAEARRGPQIAQFFVLRFLLLDASDGTVGHFLAARQAAVKCRAGIHGTRCLAPLSCLPGGMTFYFLRREPGQSREDAREALEGQAGNGEAP